MINIIDLFAGAGGLSNGFEQTGNFSVVGAVEINEAAIRTYKHNHNDENLIITQENQKTSDINAINFVDFLNKKNLKSGANDIVVIGGPPCQGFSNANRQKNYLISGNNQLVKQYVRAIKEIKPAAFLMENVKTINSDTHKFFVTHPTAEELSEGYKPQVYLKDIIKKDKILIIETSRLELRGLFEEISLGFEDTSYSINPIIEAAPLLSRLRGIVRKLKKKNIFSLKEHEIASTLQLKKLIESYSIPNHLKNNEIFADICNKASVVLDVLLSNKNISNQSLLNDLLPLLDLNKLLRFFEELRKENIMLTGNPFLNFGLDDKIQVLANVFSYNVVEYLKKVFRDMNYSFEAEVVRSINYLVPQKRERFMILGVRNDILGNRKVAFPNSLLNEMTRKMTVRDAISDLESLLPEKDISINGNIQPWGPVNVEEKSLLGYYRSDMDEQIIYNHVNTDSRETSKERFEVLNNMAEGSRNFHSLPENLKNNTYANAARTQNTVYLKLQYDEPSPTVINVRKSMWQHPNKARSISIREAARLQTFKDDFIFLGTKDQQYQQIGNAVPPLMARAVAEKMLEYLNVPVINHFY